MDKTSDGIEADVSEAMEKIDVEVRGKARC